MNLKRYFTIVNVFWQRSISYRSNVVLYRIGEVFEILILITLWTRLYATTDAIQGFTKDQMLTYVLVGGFFNIFTRNFIKDEIANNIHNGKFSALLIKPISHLRYTLVSALGRSMHLVMSTITQLVLIAIFHSVVIINTNPYVLGVIAVMIILAYVSELLLSYLIGLIAFWAEEVDGIYSTVTAIRRLLSGSLFPLAILPVGLVTLSYGLPFAYNYFVPMQLYLGKVNVVDGLRGLVIQACWIAILYLVIKVVYYFGVRRYEGSESA